ncbi:MAG: tRNA-dihydrouridine synthase family protein [Actinomycetota bacterium]|nr:tRNA-dihydrouridine synthase family protein [Actinomycetota bacterium]
MRLVLAPMEGLTDAPMRALLTSLGGYDWCVSEFVRINDTLLPARVFRRDVPESANGFRTPAGTPVHVQLLGSDPSCIAENAAVAASVGAPGIDLNFGCPAKMVNRHRGGAVLLDEPELVHAIVAAVRRALPANIPVSAKMRLGYRDRERFLDNGRGLLEAGASWITVHARTKEDGYRPPAHWHEIARLREIAGATPVIANGEVWTIEDHARCCAESGCTDVMLGRGAVASPGLAVAVRASAAGTDASLPGWSALCELQRQFINDADSSEGVAVGRYKQWLAFLTRIYPEAATLFPQARTLRTRREIEAAIVASAAAGAPTASGVRLPAATG